VNNSFWYLEIGRNSKRANNFKFMKKKLWENSIVLGDECPGLNMSLAHKGVVFASII
jgi:hypothetical protein